MCHRTRYILVFLNAALLIVLGVFCVCVCEGHTTYCSCCCTALHISMLVNNAGVSSCIVNFQHRNLSGCMLLINFSALWGWSTSLCPNRPSPHASNYILVSRDATLTFLSRVWMSQGAHTAQRCHSFLWLRSSCPRSVLLCCVNAVFSVSVYLKARWC